MKYSLFSRVCAAAFCLALAGWAVTAHRPAASAQTLAAEKAGVAAARVSVSLPSLLAGTVYPPTLKSEQIDSSFQKVDLVDTQGKQGTYVTKGETVMAGGETFFVAYFLVADPGMLATPTLAPGATLRLALINMHYIQAMTNLRPAVDSRP